MDGSGECAIRRGVGGYETKYAAIKGKQWKWWNELDQFQSEKESYADEISLIALFNC